MVSAVNIGGHLVGPGRPCFIIAEAGVNHNGALGTALQLVDVAAAAGVDAVKFQTFIAADMISPKAPKADYQFQTTEVSESQLEMVRRLELSHADFRQLFQHCQKKGIRFLSTPFDEGSADFLDALGVAAFKIASGDLTNLPFLTHVAHKEKPVILSTGMSWLDEVELAIRTVGQTGNHDLILLHCVSNYPTDPKDVNLRALETMRNALQVPVGLSDHTLGIDIALAAVALGACVIEKHFTLDRTLPGPDHRSSLEPEELSRLVRGIRTVEVALGHGRKEPAACEANTTLVARKSLVAARSIPAGSTVTEDMIAIKRPGTGLRPTLRQQLVGRRLKVDRRAGELFRMDDFE